MNALARMYRGETKWDFVGLSKRTLIVSLTLVAASILVMIIKPFNLSIDFTGGVLVSVENTSDASVEEIRGELRGIGYADARVQITGEGFVIVQTEALDAAEMDTLVVAVTDVAGADVNDANVSAVGPTFGAEVTRKAIQALVVFLIVIALFITWRFEWKMAVAALAALFHDLIITGGLYALVGFIMTPATIIAVLTILGYSLYDTVVVFDKVTENVHEHHDRSTFSGIVNLSMNQVLMRSINTSLTSLLPVGSLLLVGFLALGAETLKEFALALFIGIAVGTYSSIFVAAPILSRWKESEPEWERQRRRAGKGEMQPAAVSEVVQPEAPAVAPTSSAAPKPPKQRRKRR
ncbi:MAG: protein translocase subunit SecF [Actinomycetota bacterium]